MTVASLKTNAFHEISIPEESPFIWLLSQCSRLCDKLCLSFAGSELEISGNDNPGQLAIRVKISKLAPLNNAWKGYYRLLFNADQLLGASRLLLRASDLRLRFFDDRIDFLASRGGEVTYSALALKSNSSLMARPRYSHSFKVPREAILTLCKAGSIYSNEVRLRFKRRDLQLFRASNLEIPLVSIQVPAVEPNGSADAVLPGSYLQRVSELVKRADAESVSVSVQEEKPLSLGFDFSRSSRVTLLLGGGKTDPDSHDALDRRKSPPDFNSCPVVELVTFVGMKASGIDVTLMRSAGLDTANSLNLRQAENLGLITTREGIAKTTTSARAFLSLMRSNPSKAKQMLHQLALNQVPCYKIVADRLDRSPSSLEELLTYLQRESSGPSPVSINYVSSLLGILTWCGHAKRKHALKYSLVSRSRRFSR